MRAILVNIGLVPVLFMVVPLLILLSLAPHGGRLQHFRRQMLNLLDRITNDYGAELIYLAGPSDAEDVAEIPKNPQLLPRRSTATRTNLLVVPDRRPTLPSPTTRSR
jgi:hypothetical protein